jgi:hypothetical protein
VLFRPRVAPPDPLDVITRSSVLLCHALPCTCSFLLYKQVLCTHLGPTVRSLCKFQRAVPCSASIPLSGPSASKTVGGAVSLASGTRPPRDAGDVRLDGAEWEPGMRLHAARGEPPASCIARRHGKFLVMFQDSRGVVFLGCDCSALTFGTEIGGAARREGAMMASGCGGGFAFCLTEDEILRECGMTGVGMRILRGFERRNVEDDFAGAVDCCWQRKTTCSRVRAFRIKVSGISFPKVRQVLLHIGF